MSLTWFFTKSRVSSTNACRFDGTPVVALRVTSQRKPKVRMPMTTVVISVSQLIDQKPPASPTGLVRNVRWCWM
jgi:hypothetical protein